MNGNVYIVEYIDYDDTKSHWATPETSNEQVWIKRPNETIVLEKEELLHIVNTHNKKWNVG